MMCLPNTFNNEKLSNLIKEAKSCPADSTKRQELFDQIPCLAIASGEFQAKFDKRRVHCNDYDLVLQDTWEYCFQHLDEYPAQDEKKRGIDWIKDCFGECLQRRLFSLFEKAKSYNSDSHNRESILCQIWRLTLVSGKLWRGYLNKNDYYDALHDTFDYCLWNHLDEYDSSEQRVITWINKRLEKKIQSIETRHRRENERIISGFPDDNGSYLNPVDFIPNPPESEASQIWQELIEWVEEDPNQQLRSIRFPKNRDITAQDMVLLKLKFGKDLSEIAISLGLSPEMGVHLSKWYSRRKVIRDILVEWAKVNGYLQWDEKAQRYLLDLE